MVKLTMKQQKFADEYIISGNATQAYMIAYPNVKKESTARAAASRMLANVNVKAYIDARLEELKKESIAEQDEVLQYLTAVMRGEMKDEALIVVPIGDFESEVQRHDQRADTSQRTKAAELLGKRYGLFRDIQEVEHSGAVQFVDDIE
ncbi:terminase small subunit [Jeotgalicoccus sp. FSL K6-3177]|uniref:terminase small subunit n=1 Tax=Jeotgalicoccus sp. FSL K6-3177 TaxID=2921494 RepID=UPI0030FD598F